MPNKMHFFFSYYGDLKQVYQINLYVYALCKYVNVILFFSQSAKAEKVQIKLNM